MKFSGDGKWASARLKNHDGAVTYELQALDGGIIASVIAPEFKYGQTKLQNVLLTGKMGLSGMDGAQFGANWLGGAVKGVVGLDLSSKLSLKGQVKLDAVGFEQLATLLNGQGVVQGRVSGAMVVAGEADGVWRVDALRWSGTYSVADGSIGRIDLVEAMRRRWTGADFRRGDALRTDGGEFFARSR